MPDIGDFIRRSRRSAKIAIAAPGTPGDFPRSRRSAYKIAKCVAGLRSGSETIDNVQRLSHGKRLWLYFSRELYRIYRDHQTTKTDILKLRI